MTEFFFYHLFSKGVLQALPSLVEKAYERSLSSFVYSESPALIEEADAFLWTYSENSFLPHEIGLNGDCPILLNTSPLPSPRDVMFALDVATLPPFKGFQRVCLLFDGRNEDSLNRARAHWRNLSEIHKTYWKQSENGWEKVDLS